MKPVRNRAAAVALAIALATVASACGSSGSTLQSEPASTATAPAPVAPTSTIPEGAVDISAPAGAFPPKLISRFQAVSGCQVAVQAWPAASDAPARLRSLLGRTDLVSVRADRLRPLARAGLVVPVDSGEIDGLGAIPSRLRSLQAAAFDGDSYAMPYAWEPLVLLSRDDDFPDGPPTSLRALWEPARSQTVALPGDPLTLATAALSVGVDDPFSLQASDLAAAAGLLQLARPGHRWSSSASLEALFSSGQVELALGPPRVAAALRGQVPLAATMPVEGAVGLVRALAIAARAPHPVCAYRFLSYLLEPASQAAVAAATGFTPVVPLACRVLGGARCSTLHAKDQWGAGVQFARRPAAPAAPWTRWLSDWRALG